MSSSAKMQEQINQMDKQPTSESKYGVDQVNTTTHHGPALVHGRCIPFQGFKFSFSIISS